MALIWFIVLSLLTKVKNLNNFFDKNQFVNLLCHDDKIGVVHKKIAKIILKSKLPFLSKSNNLIFKENKKKKLNLTLENICELLIKKKIIKMATGEKFPCVLSLGRKEYFVLDEH